MNRRTFLALGLGLAGTALMLIPVFLFAQGDAATHARLHLAAAITVMVLAAAVALIWRSPRRLLESSSRRALIVSLSLLAAAQLTEAGGALAWASDGEAVRYAALVTVHTAATAVGAVAVIAVAISAIPALGALVVRLAETRRDMARGR